jgi:fluoride exporter
MNLLPFFSIGAGAIMGALLRWGLGLWLNPLLPQLPLGTLAANLGGGYIIGLAIAFFELHQGLAPEYRLFLVTGFLGALTTFSTFSAEAVTTLMRGQYAWGLVIISTHLLGSLLMTVAGIHTMKWLHQ